MTLQTTYKKTKAIVNKRIKDGSLGEEYELPPLSTFNVPKGDFPKADYVFVPTGMTLSQWDKLLKKTCNGLWRSSVWDDDLFEDLACWVLWLVSGADSPEETNVSKEDLDKRGVELPSAQVFIAQQWLRLEMGKEPVDKDTWTMACETTDLYVAGVDWFRSYRRVYLDYWSADDRYDDYGVRGAESGSKALNLGSSFAAPNLSAADLQENTKALNRVADLLERIYNV